MRSAIGSLVGAELSHQALFGGPAQVGRRVGGAASGLVQTARRVGGFGCGSWDGRQVASIACRRVALEDCASRVGFGTDSLDGGLEGGGPL